MVSPDSDYEAIRGGQVSITPMQLMQTDYEALADLQGAEFDGFPEPESQS